MKHWLTDFGIKRPWWVVGLMAIAVVIFAIQFPKVNFDNDPENMLDPNEHVRVFHDEVKERFGLYDFVIVGIVNEEHAEGVFNVETLGRIHRLTNQLLSLHQSPEGLPTIREDGTERTLDLRSESPFQQLLAFAFRQDANRLFTEEGDSAIIGREVISPSVVDNLRQEKLGALKIEYLMEEAPETPAEAARIREDAMNNPLYKGTLVSEDGKALALYIPIVEKTYSHNVANLVTHLTADWPEDIHITGLPVAEDTFGVQMLNQMAISAPIAGLMIFLLLLFFFKRLNLVIAPMVVAIVSVIASMGLLIGLGFDVHIMSSMIAIFVMPIAVVDAIHILSEFHDVYQKFRNKAEAIRNVIGHLFMPMLYTTFTTMAGFGSLAFTPIPPVKVFGLHVAFGVFVAWLLTMAFIPAYIMLFVSDKSLESFGHSHDDASESPAMQRFLASVGAFTGRAWKPILGVSLLLLAVAGYGISRIQINDNPVKWFTEDHELRVADRVLNAHFGGTYTAYLTLRAEQPDAVDCRTKAATIAQRARERFGEARPAATKEFIRRLEGHRERFANLETSDYSRCFVDLVKDAEELDARSLESWQTLADEINYLDPEGLDVARVRAAVAGLEGLDTETRQVFEKRLAQLGQVTGAALQERALEITDEYTAMSFVDFVHQQEAELSAPLWKQPEMLRWLRDLQRHLHEHPLVGKTTSAADALVKANYELNYLAPPAVADEEVLAAARARNESYQSVPPTAAGTGQVFIQLEGMKKKDSLFHLVTRDYEQANLWVQLKSGDNRDMAAVVSEVETYLREHPAPTAVSAEWAGLTYLNVVWQDKMVSGMLSSLGSSFVVVLVLMIVLFRSPLFGILSMVPLTITIALIYGLIGLVGKDYDMPVAVLSSLTLGLSIDFAIHFLERAREMVKLHGTWQAALPHMFAEPATAITRNGIVIAIGFTPLLLAPLVPYKTVGFFLATIMAVSGLATLLITPALLAMLQRWAFPQQADTEAPAAEPDEQAS